MGQAEENGGYCCSDESDEDDGLASEDICRTRVPVVVSNKVFSSSDAHTGVPAPGVDDCKADKRRDTALGE